MPPHAVEGRGREVAPDGLYGFYITVIRFLIGAPDELSATPDQGARAVRFKA